MEPESIDKNGRFSNLPTLSENAKVFMFVGRMVEEKGLPILIDLIKEDTSDSLFVIASKGNESNPYHQQISQLVNDGRKAVFLDNDEKQNEMRLFFMGMSDFALIPSTAETFGLTAAEASLMGMYVLYSNVGGLPDSVTKFSLPVVSNDFKSWQSAVNKAMSDSFEVDNIVQFAKERFPENILAISTNKALDEAVLEMKER